MCETAAVAPKVLILVKTIIGAQEQNVSLSQWSPSDRHSWGR